MNLIPQKLFDHPQVKTILRAGNVCILEKTLHAPVVKQAGYLAHHVIVMLLAGQQEITNYEGQKIKLKAGEVLFIPRGMYQITDLVPETAPFHSVLCYFDNQIIQDFLATAKVTQFSAEAAPDHLKLGLVPSVRIFAEALLQLYTPTQKWDAQLLSLKIMELLFLLNTLCPEQQLSNFLFRLTLPKKRNIKNFMELNFKRPFKVEDYAYLTGRSLSSFRRTFKANYHCTPQKWLQEKRLALALTLLQKQELSVTEVSYEVGYENVSYFIKAFKAKMGISPKQYLLRQVRNQLSS